MPMSQRSTLWAVSGAIGLTSFGLGAFALQGSGPAPIEARPAVVVPLSTPAGTPSGTATSTPSASPSDGPSATASPSSTHRTPSAKPSAKSSVSPVSPPSAETPD
ncbi:MAG TPA: hypothetical protein PKV13_06760 [Propionicimonas sp.]|nr:hypothetical protein [Propionicimonas sp.]